MKSKRSRRGPSPSFFPTTAAEAIIRGRDGSITVWLPVCFIIYISLPVLQYFYPENEKNTFGAEIKTCFLRQKLKGKVENFYRMNYTEI